MNRRGLLRSLGGLLALPVMATKPTAHLDLEPLRLAVDAARDKFDAEQIGKAMVQEMKQRGIRFSNE